MKVTRNMHKISYDSIDETVYKAVLTNGLTVYIAPKRSFAKTYGVFMTNYGSIDREFVPIGQNEPITVPDGIAHFLEHKLFEKETYDVFSTFLRQGASPNAFTSFTKTAYLFSTTEHVAENVETLLNFVQEPYFSDASVKKEKGIIAQEIKMYNDLPDWQAMMGTIRNMYENHPIRIDIAGTVESIEEITKEHLYTCYETFYHPANMILFVIGNVNPEQLFERIERNQTKKSFPKERAIQRFIPDEKDAVYKQETTVHLPVQVPKVALGIKGTVKGLTGDQMIREECIQSILLDYFFAESGLYYEELYADELIDQSFTYSATVEQSFQFVLLQSNTNNVAQFEERMQTLLQNMKEHQLDESLFLTMKRKQIGEYIRAFNSLEFIANQYAQYQFQAIDLFSIPDVIESITLQEMQSYLERWITDDNITVCRVMQE